MATLEQILGFRNLTGVVQAIKSGIPNPLEGTGFFAKGQSLSGNKGEFYKITGNRKTARAVHYGSPAVRRNLRDVSLVPFTMLHTFESQQWPMDVMILLSKMNELAHDKKAQEQAEYQCREFKRLFANLRIAATLMAIFKGIIYFDANGELLPSSSGSAYNIDYSVPANNKNQANGIIGVKWPTASAPIISQLQKLQTQALKLTGYPLTHAFYGDSVAGWVGTNDEAKYYLARNPAMNNHYLNTGTIPDGFAGIERWIKAGHAFYEDSAGVNQQICADDAVVVTPTPSPEWWEQYEGSYLIPNSIQIQPGADAASALANVTEAYGMFAYGLLCHNPTTVEQFAGDTFFPALKVPGTIFQLDVDF